MAWAWLLWVGCGPGEPVLDLAPDPTRTGEAGEHGPFGAAHLMLDLNARVTDRVKFEVSWPSDDAGEPVRSEGELPVIALVQGGLVDLEDYRWLATHFASRGYLVVRPEHDLDLAIAETANVSIAVDELERLHTRPGDRLEGLISDRMAIGGHSLGGAVAAFRWVAEPRFEGLMLLASWPADSADVEGFSTRPLVSLIGGQEHGDSPQTAFDAVQRFDGPSLFGLVDGMNHMDWTDAPDGSGALEDGTSTRPRAETRVDAQHVLDVWLDAWLRDDDAAMDRLDESFEGIGDTP